MHAWRAAAAASSVLSPPGSRAQSMRAELQVSDASGGSTARGGQWPVHEVNEAGPNPTFYALRPRKQKRSVRALMNGGVLIPRLKACASPASLTSINTRDGRQKPRARPSPCCTGGLPAAAGGGKWGDWPRRGLAHGHAAPRTYTPRALATAPQDGRLPPLLSALPPRGMRTDFIYS